MLKIYYDIFGEALTEDFIFLINRSSHQWCSVRRKTPLETLTQVFSCKFCEISKNTFFTEHLWTTASQSRPDNK